MFLQFFENRSNSIEVGLALIFGVNEDIIQINNTKNIEFFNKNLIDLALKTS